jgi:hypothetical protein
MLFFLDLLLEKRFKSVKVFLNSLIALVNGIDLAVLKLIKVMIELFKTDSFMIRDSLLMAIINSFEAVKTNPAVEIAFLINADKLIGLIMFVAVIDPEIHTQCY